MSSPVEVMLGRLERVHQNGQGWIARCPAHDDHEPSLKVDIGDDGRVMLHCHAGCETQAVVEAIGLTMRDLFVRRNGGGGGEYYPLPNGSNTRTPRQTSKKIKKVGTVREDRTADVFDSNGSNTPPPGLTLKQYADAKRLPLKTVLTYGVSDMTLSGQPAVRIPYRDRQGEEVAVRFRLALDGDHKFRWRNKSKPFLYGLWRLQGGPAVTLVEGESDCHTLWSCGVEAAGLPGASNWREERDASELASYARIYVVIEPDGGGEAVQRWLERSAIRERAWLLDLAPFKDPSALYLDDPERFSERWQAAIEKAVSWTAQADARQQQDRQAWYTEAKRLLEASDLLERIGRSMQQRGYAGDVSPALLGYVAFTSRLLDRPINLSYVAPSAAGKNRAVDEAKAFMPPEAYYEIDAGSDRALIYTDEDYQRRVVVFGEADSIPDEGAAASAVRNLAAKNALAYDVVEKDPRTGKHQTRHLVKPGPTGLITTSTKSLAHQLDTRVFEVPISDDADLTRAIIKSQALRAAGKASEPPDLAPYHALQRYLAAQGDQRVIVPYAEVLHELVPVQAVRMRRDFNQLLTCIKTIALLYQQQHERTPDGAIIATIEDYAHACKLLAPIFDTIVAEGVTPAIRTLIAAVKPDEDIGVSTLARRLNLSKSTVSYHVRRAIEGGWLINYETRKGLSAKLALGAPLPDQTHALPDPDRVQEVFECSSRTVQPSQTLEQQLSHDATNKTTKVFECSSALGEDRGPPPPHVLHVEVLKSRCSMAASCVGGV
jgi:Winged helix-turn-helix DNA-binding